MFEEIGRRLSQMVQIPTVSGDVDPELYQIERYRDYLEKEFAYLFRNAERYPIGEAMLLCLRGPGKEGRGAVLFTGHMDVVPVDASAWKYPPFSGEIVDGCVWGRGTQDMKGPHCAFLSAVNVLVKEGWKPQEDVWIYLSCDEEIGGMTTQKAADWLKKNRVHFDMVFDEGGTICEDFMGLVPGRAALLGISEKGSLEYRFTARSAGGHAANPPANSAIVRLARLMCEAEDRDLFERRLTEGNRLMLLAIADCCERKTDSCRAGKTACELAGKLRLAANEEPPYPMLYELTPDAHNLLGATIAFTILHAGSAYNVMPKKAELIANVRVSSVEGEREATEKLKKLAEKYDVECELLSGSDAAPESAADGPYYQAMKQSIEKIYPGLPVIPFVLGGGTDSRHFLEITDQVLRFSPMHAYPEQGRGVHGDNEYATIQDVAEAARCYYVLLKEHL